MKPEEEIAIVQRMIIDSGPRWVGVRPRDTEHSGVLVAFEPRVGYRVWLPDRDNDRHEEPGSDPSHWFVERVEFEDRIIANFFAAFGSSWALLLASEVVDVSGPPCKVRAFVGNTGPSRDQWSISLDVPAAGAGREPLIKLREIRAEAFKLCTARADDRCWMDIEKLCGLLDVPFDPRVGDKSAMLENCRRFIDQKCEGGGWPSYAELEEIVRASAKQRCILSRVHSFFPLFNNAEFCETCWLEGRSMVKESDPWHDLRNEPPRCQSRDCLPCRSKALVDLFGTMLALPSHRKIDAPKRNARADTSV